MSLPDTPVDTEARQILAAIASQNERIDRLADAVNGLGANVQWIVDNVQGIFKMFGSPQFMHQMMGVMGNGGFPGAAGPGDAGAGTDPPE